MSQLPKSSPAFKSSHRHARITPRKARYVMDLVRHKPVGRALELLRFTQRRAAPLISQVVQSAVANAVQEGGVRAEDLIIISATVDDGPTWKRWRPRARGMAYPILKRTSHLNIVVCEASKSGRPQAGGGKSGGGQAEGKKNRARATGAKRAEE